MLTREAALKTVVDGISWLDSQAKLRGTIHLFDAHTVMQEVFCLLLNEMHDLQLKVLDNIQPNFPAIDLGDEVRKRAFQITAETTSKKAQETLNAYARHNLAPRYGRLQIIMIGDRQGTYDKLNVPPAISFAWEDDIIDTKRLIRQITGLGTEKLMRVAEVIRKEIGLPGSHLAAPSKPMQSTKIARCGYNLPILKRTDGKGTDPEALKQFFAFVHEGFARCFGHVCVTLGIEDFVYMLTLEPSAEDDKLEWIPYDFELHCHITEFVRTVEARMEYFLSKGTTPFPKLETLPGNQSLHTPHRFGRDLTYRIFRSPPSEIVIEQVDNVPSPPSKITTTSQLLCLLAAGFKHKVLLWDEIETYPDAEKVMAMLDKIGRTRFSWDSINLNPNNPEAWEFIG
ncbi:MAG: SMEK domain-containing protein [Planctomycetia bacterium]|nr:SMEK domain-containing protein [Planctomycetia bacterium]